MWAIPNVKSNHVEKTSHPCQFPVELAERLVLSMTNKGGWVLDPFLGSGTSLIAALKHGRRGAGAEISREYINIAYERISRLKRGSLKCRPMNMPVYDPKKPNGGQIYKIRPRSDQKSLFQESPLDFEL